MLFEEFMRSRTVMMALVALAISACAKDEGLEEVRGTVYIGDQPSQKGAGYVTSILMTPRATSGKRRQWAKSSRTAPMS
jgi:hypothetical protein